MGNSIREIFAKIVGLYPQPPNNDFACSRILNMAGFKDITITSIGDKERVDAQHIQNIAVKWENHWQDKTMSMCMYLDDYLFLLSLYNLRPKVEFQNNQSKSGEGMEYVATLTASRYGENFVFVTMGNDYDGVKGEIKALCEKYGIKPKK
ncbi:MAG: hypothetical protein KKG59_07205 [Nanoarchaeota archaeon]|nr:hypothetical protein [Nanoarchaeota archaeon]